MTVDVSGGIALWVTQFLSDLERLLKIHAVADHFCEDKVCCTVQNTGDFVDLVSGKTRMKRLDDRNSAAYACFEEEVHVLLLGDGEKLRALGSNKLLVRCNNALACLERGLYEIICRLESADNLGYDRNLRVIKNIIEILDKLVLVGAVAEITDIEDILDIHFLSSLLFKAFLVLIENLNCS